MAGKKVPDAEQIELEARCLDLRRRGMTYDAIAVEVGYSNPTGARRAVYRALGRTLQDKADDVRRLEVDRLDRILYALWPYIDRAPHPDDPDAEIPPPIVEAIDRVLKVMDRRAKLLGLDTPVKTEVTGPGGAPLTVEVLSQLLPNMAKADEQADAGATGDG